LGCLTGQRIRPDGWSDSECGPVTLPCPRTPPPSLRRPYLLTPNSHFVGTKMARSPLLVFFSAALRPFIDPLAIRFGFRRFFTFRQTVLLLVDSRSRFFRFPRARPLHFRVFFYYVPPGWSCPCPPALSRFPPQPLPSHANLLVDPPPWYLTHLVRFRDLPTNWLSPLSL